MEKIKRKKYAYLDKHETLEKRVNRVERLLGLAFTLIILLGLIKLTEVYLGR